MISKVFSKLVDSVISWSEVILWSGLFYWVFLENSKYIMNGCPEPHLLILLTLQMGNTGKTPERGQSSRLETASGRNTKIWKRIVFQKLCLLFPKWETQWKSSLHTCICSATVFHLLGYQWTMKASKHCWYPAQAPHQNWCNLLNSTGNRFFTSIYTLPLGLRSRRMLYL